MKKSFCDGCGKELGFPIKPIAATITRSGVTLTADACTIECLIKKIQETFK